MAAKVSIAGRTVWDFQTDLNPWPVLEEFAQRKGYKLVDAQENSRLYQQGSGFWMAPRMLYLASTPSGYRLEAWVSVEGINRILTFGLFPREMVVHSGGFLGAAPRAKARKQVNEFLQALGQPLIS